MLRTKNPAVRAFSAVRYYLFVTLLLAFVIYDGLGDKYNFLFVLMLTGIGIGTLAWAVAHFKRVRTRGTISNIRQSPLSGQDR